MKHKFLHIALRLLAGFFILSGLLFACNNSDGFNRIIYDVSDWEIVKLEGEYETAYCKKVSLNIETEQMVLCRVSGLEGDYDVFLNGTKVPLYFKTSSFEYFRFSGMRSGENQESLVEIKHVMCDSISENKPVFDLIKVGKIFVADVVNKHTSFNALIKNVESHERHILLKVSFFDYNGKILKKSEQDIFIEGNSQKKVTQKLKDNNALNKLAVAEFSVYENGKLMDRYQKAIK